MTKEDGQVRIRVNGTWHDFEITPQTMLLELLRDRLNLTGAKNGCNSGHCGACTVIVEGEAVRSCIYKARRADGKSVETIEGLTRDGSLHPLQQAFIDRGAVQCGYCTPGMILAAKALLDRVPNPTEDQIKAALKQNLCRCTGYTKIIEAVQAATGALNEVRLANAGSQAYRVVGTSLTRAGARDRVTGETRYTGDLVVDGMLHARVLRAAWPHAWVRRVDVSRARQMPGVAAVLTAQDVPGAKNHGVIIKDWPVLAYDKVRYMGDAVAIVAAETESQAAAALAAIEVDYERLPIITSPQAGLDPEAVKVHEKGNVLKEIVFSRGDVEAGLAQADVIIDKTYETPFGEHAFLEPEAALAVPDLQSGGVTVYVGSQIPFEDRTDIAASLGLPEDKVRVVHMPTGGAFGGKEDIMGQIHVALLAQATRHPVKLVFSRPESMRTHPKRHATTIHMRTGATKDGRIVAQKIHILGDTGAYASLGGPVMTRAATHSTGPYDIPNVSVECYAVYTNNPPAGAFRGFGATQAHFAAESQMDLVAEAVGLSPFEIRRRNALQVGATTASGQVLRESVGLLECLNRVRAAVEEIQAQTGPEGLPPHLRRGWGWAAAYKNVGLGSGLADSAGATVELSADGRVFVKAGAAEVGQGHDDVLRQIASEVLGVEPDDVDVLLGDTALTPDSGATTASRQTYVTGNAVRYAALKLRDLITQMAAEILDCAPELLRFEGGEVRAADRGRSVLLRDVAAAAEQEGRLPKVTYVYTPPATVNLGEKGDSHFAYGYGVQAVQVEVNTQTGQVRVLDVIGAHDVGQAMNPLALAGQVEGGILMGIGYALTERFVVEEGVVRTDTFAKYKIPDITYTPRIVSMVVEHPTADGPFGAKGVGELTSMPTAPAIANAVARAIGFRSVALPINADMVKAACQAR
jgi:selenium-dependent xanthine dehydrogenase